MHLLRNEEPDTALVFCRTKVTVHKVTKYLREKGIEAREIHGDMQQEKRNRVMASMRTGRLAVLIASDLAARGLDIDHISHVVNFDLPEDPEVYVHRIGRTARVGRRGVAWSFVTPDQGRLLTQIEKLIGVMIEQKDYPSFKPGPLPRDIRDERHQQQEAQEKREQAVRSRREPQQLDQLSKEELKRMFPPDGIPPKTTPGRTLGSRLPTRRRR